MRKLFPIFLLAITAACTQHLSAGSLPPAKVTLGDEAFLNSGWRDLHGRCVGVITNQTGVTSQLVNIVDAIEEHNARASAADRICMRAIYSPEHGLRGDRPAGSYVGSYIDARTGLPVYSLYGSQRHPTAAMLKGVDVLLFDIQDVGARSYTYISTMAYAMQAAAQYDKEIWILDRPNPIGGNLVEGPVLDPQFKSFIGLYPIAMRHGMTIGELARMFNDAFGIGAKLRVIPMRGWHRSMVWSDTQLYWVQSSPNVPEWTTTVVYICTGLINGAGINGGIGTTKPFKYAGAYGLDAYALARRLNALNLPGVFFRPAYWSPSSGFWSGKDLSGVELVVFDPHVFQGVRSAIELMAVVRALEPSLLRFEKGFDTDWGTDTVRKSLQSGASANAIVNAWQPALARFMILRSKYLLYN